MVLESTVGSNYKNVALPLLFVAYCTMEDKLRKPVEQRKKREGKPLPRSPESS